MSIKDRILAFLKEQGISREDFYRTTGLSASNFKGAALKSELGGEKIVKILTTYEALSPEWLLMGDGSMLKQNMLDEKNTDNMLVSSDKYTSSNRINQVETSYIYKMYLNEKEDWKEEKKELKIRIDQLQAELRQKSEELATLKAKFPEAPIAHSEVLGSSETALFAHSHPHSPTSEHYHGSSLPPHQKKQ